MYEFDEYSDTPTRKMKQDFYDSWEWKELRYRALAKYGRKCASCGCSPGDGYPLHVDHVQPISKHWYLRFEIFNLQVLCKDCNMGKSNKDETDFRPKVTWESIGEEDRLKMMVYGALAYKNAIDASIPSHAELCRHLCDNRLDYQLIPEDWTFPLEKIKPIVFSLYREYKEYRAGLEKNHEFK